MEGSPSACRHRDRVRVGSVRPARGTSSNMWLKSWKHVAEELDRYRAGDADAFAVDETIHHYHRSAQELGYSAGPAAPQQILR